MGLKLNRSIKIAYFLRFFLCRCWLPLCIFPFSTLKVVWHSSHAVFVLKLMSMFRMNIIVKHLAIPLVSATASSPLHFGRKKTMQWKIYFYVISKIVENVSWTGSGCYGVPLASPSSTTKYHHIAIDYGRMKQTLICIAILLFSAQTNASLMGMNVFTFIQIYCVCNSAPMYTAISASWQPKSKRCRWSRFSIRIQFITDLTRHTRAPKHTDLDSTIIPI